jgi:hypothetical protein
MTYWRKFTVRNILKRRQYRSKWIRRSDVIQIRTCFVAKRTLQSQTLQKCLVRIRRKQLHLWFSHLRKNLSQFSRNAGRSQLSTLARYLNPVSLGRETSAMPITHLNERHVLNVASERIVRCLRHQPRRHQQGFLSQMPLGRQRSGPECSVRQTTHPSEKPDWSVGSVRAVEFQQPQRPR